MEATRVTLLQRLGRPGADEAWQEFYEIYGPVLLKYAEKCGLDEALAEDVLQETMMALLRLMPGFRYDEGRGRFRGFLMTLIYRRVANARKRLHMRNEIPMTHDLLQKLAEELQDDNAIPPGNEMDQKWMESISEEAWQRVVNGLEKERQSMADVYDAHVRQGRPIAEVARQFGVRPDYVYQTKNLIEERLARELRNLKQALEFTGGHEIPPAK